MAVSPLPQGRAARRDRPGGRTRLLWLPALAYAALLYAISDRPLPPDALPRFSGADKLAHGVAYAGLGALLGLPLQGLTRTAGAAVRAAAVLASAYGATDEWHQSFVPGREADWADWLADSAGGALGAAGLVAARRRRAKGPESVT